MARDEVCAMSYDVLANPRWLLHGEGGANWKYLLPINERSRVLSTEVLDGETLDSLARSVSELTVACQNREECGIVTGDITKRGLRNVTVTVTSRQEASGLVEGYDVVLASADRIESLNLLSWFLKPGFACIVIEGKRRAVIWGNVKSSDLGQSGAIAYVPFPDASSFRLLVCCASRKLERRSFELHNTMKFGNRLKKSAAVVLSSVGLLGIAAPRRFCILMKSDHNDDSILLGFLKKKFPSDDIYLALHPGSHGKSNKAIVQVMNSSGDILAYAKVADNPDARAYLKNECETLQYLGGLQLEKGDIPSVIDYTETRKHTILLLSVPRKMGKFSPIEIRPKHVDWLQELSRKTAVKDTNAAGTFLNNAREGIKRVLEAEVLLRPERAVDLFEKSLVEISGNNIQYALAQCDFTPWNIRIVKDRIFVLDWEWAKRISPPLQDFFHFLYQTNLLVKNLGSVETARALFFKQNSSKDVLNAICNVLGVDRQLAYPLFVFYAFDLLMRGIEIGSDVVIDKQVALVNALIERREFSRKNFSVV
jgi:hypothetical protein